MKSILMIGLMGVLSLNAQTPVVLKQIGNFKAGEKTIYAKVDLKKFDVGASGENVIWNFSNEPDTKSIIIKTIKSIEGNKYQKIFKKSNTVLNNDDSSCVFLEIKGDTNKIYGFVDEKSGMVVEYTIPFISIVRPVKYRDSIYSVSERKFESHGYNYIGKGFASYIVDGYGKLITPNGTYNDVLRIKSVQDFTDVMTNGYGDMKMKMITYDWYDNLHKNAICKVSYMEIKSQYFNAEYTTIQFIQNNL